MDSSIPVMNESMDEMIYQINHILNCGVVKSSEVMIPSAMNAILAICVEKLAKFRTSTVLEPVTP